MLITISGLPGSGKTTVARLVAATLGLEHVYAGNIFRRQAEEAGLTIHVRVIEGEDTGHALAAIFKALGVALARAIRGGN